MQRLHLGCVICRESPDSNSLEKASCSYLSWRLAHSVPLPLGKPNTTITKGNVESTNLEADEKHAGGSDGNYRVCPGKSGRRSFLRPPSEIARIVRLSAEQAAQVQCVGMAKPIPNATDFAACTNPTAKRKYWDR